MSEECEFYFYDHDYCCSLLKQNNKHYVVDSDWVHRYCWGYHCNECPYYRNKTDMSSSSGGCYLTSACVYARNLSDNCYELNTLRKFRDEYIRNISNGNEEIKHYYVIAPLIVDKINNSSEAIRKWGLIYDELIAPCINLIEKEQFQEAYQQYKKYTLKLESEYL